MGIKWMIKKSDYNEIRKSLNKEADSKKLEALKKEVIAILEKKESQEYKKAIEHFEMDEGKYTHLEKSVSGDWIEKAGYGVGTVRIWKGKKYKKVSASPVRWVRVFDKNDRGAATSMGKYIAQVKACKTAEDLYNFCLKQRSLFQDDNGVDLPIMDKLKATIDEQSGKIERGEVNKPAEKKESENKTKESPKATVTDSQTTERVISEYLGDKKNVGDRIREGNKEIVFGNDYTKKHKLEFKVHMSGAFLGKPKMDQALFDELSKYDQGADTNELSKKYGIDGAEVLGLISKVNEGRVDIVGDDNKESEAEKHQNRSDAMKGNKNAYKGKTEMEKMPLDDLEKYKDELYKEYSHIDIEKKDKLGAARERYREAKDIWRERIQKERDVQLEFETQLMNRLQKMMSQKPLYVEKWNLKEMTDGNLKRYIEGGEKWKDKGLVHLADPVIEKFKNSKKEMFDDNNDFVGPALNYDFYAISHTDVLENMKKELESRKNASPEKKEEIKEQTKDDKPIKNQNISLNPYEPTENTNPDELKPISTNTSTGNNQVTLPYSKDLSNEIKSLVNCTGNDNDTRGFLKKVYYDNGNLISTDGRRLKVVTVGELNGIESGCYVDIDNSKEGVKITKNEKFTEENKFPQYKRVIPESLDQKITLDNKALKNKIKTLKDEGGWSNKDPIISFEIQDGNLMLDGEKVGDAKGVQFEGNAITSDFFNMNAEFVLNALSGDTSNLMCSSNSEKAMTIGTNSTLNVLMPMSKTTIKYGQNGKQEEYVNRKDYKSQKASKSAEREQKNKLKTARQDSLNEYVGELQKQWNDEKINKVINSVNDTNMEGHVEVIKRAYESLKKAEKMINNPTSSYDDSKQSNRYGYNLYAICQMNPKFKTDLENMAKKYGIEVRKSLFDYIDFELDDFEDEDYSDYDASQPDLFNSTSYKVGAALDSIFGC